MKKTVIIITSIIILSLLCGVICTAQGSDGASADISGITSNETSDSGYVNTEKEAAKLTWVYFVIGGLTFAGVTATAVLITKKFKENTVK